MVAGKHDERRAEALRVEARDEVGHRLPRGREIGQPDLAAALAQHRRDERERVGRLGRAEHLFALLAAALARKGNAADERRIHEQCAGSQHAVSSISTVRPARPAPDRPARRWRRLPAPVASSTLQQRRHTGNSCSSTSFLRSDTYFSPVHTSSSVCGGQVANFHADERAESTPCRCRTPARRGTDTGIGRPAACRACSSSG